MKILPGTSIWSRLRRLNWPLLVGIILVGGMILIAIKGPDWAPQDPMEENYALVVNGRIRTPPYPPFKIPGYPLGTDPNGRDLWSRILWGVRPTMIMVAIVAGVRLVLGLVLGLFVGWMTGKRGRRLDSLLSTLLSIPVLIVALIGIYAIGTDKGIWAFIFGLGLTGWAESARLVSEQTRVVKGQAFVEAARALGGKDRHILFQHVLPQIMSLIWVLLAFEISNTLLVSTELGFLGYYIGGGVWIEISDFHAVNVAGLPELGQMLSTVLIKLNDPSGLLIVGTFIFLGVLGFNLLGEGLRLQLSQERMTGGRRFFLLSTRASEQLEEKVIRPFSYWLEQNRKKIWIVVNLFLVVMCGWLIWGSSLVQSRLTHNEEVSVLGGHLWATELHDQYGTSWVPYSLEMQPELTWRVDIPGGPSGGPVVAADGTIIIAGKDNVLLAFMPQGEKLWEVTLDAPPVGTPALDAQGRVFVADINANVTAFDSQGNKIWQVQASQTRQATSGPIVSSDGMIYLTVVDAVVGISPEGVLIWRKTATDVFVEQPPRLSAAEDLVYLKDVALDAKTGEKQDIEVYPAYTLTFSEPAFFTGVDGNNYYRSGHEVVAWRLTDSGVQVDAPLTWQYQSFVVFNPIDQGVTANGLAWLFYGSQYGDGRIVWLDSQSRVTGNFRFAHTNSRLMAIGEQSEAYLCGPTGSRIECVAIRPGAAEPLWQIYLNVASRPVGGALVPDAFYIAVDGDGLYALSPQGGVTRP